MQVMIFISKVQITVIEAESFCVVTPDIIVTLTWTEYLLINLIHIAS
jgi:hypothetical protein